MDWTQPETWFTFTWYNRRQDEGKNYNRKETTTNAKWCNQQVLWRFKERGWRQKLVEEKSVINLPSKAENRRENAMARRPSSVCLSVCMSACLSVCKLFAQIAFSRRKMAGSRPNLYKMVSRWACIQGMLKFKVEVKGHVILAHL